MSLSHAERQRNVYANVLASLVADGHPVDAKVLANWIKWDAAVKAEESDSRPTA